VDLSNCEREPIHIPGLIQPHGALIVADASDLRIVYSSDNVEPVIGIPAAALLGRPLQDCLPSSIFQKSMRIDEQGRTHFEPLRSYDLSIGGSLSHFEVRQFNGLIYIEIEPGTPDLNAPFLPAIAQTMVGRMRAANSLTELLEVAVIELRRLTGYDRVMAYQFAADSHGMVVAEAVDPEMESYLGLHYPASDIPAQARRLYLLQRIRVIADCGYIPVNLLAHAGLRDADGGVPPLDLTFCNLRSVSPIHVEYLRNMGVSATMTLSLIVDDDLWGMLVCHHRTPRLPSSALRSSCDLISQMTSFLIRARLEFNAVEQARLAASRVAEIAVHLYDQPGVSNALIAAREPVLALVGAAGALICFEGKSELVGTCPPVPKAIELMNRLHALSGGKVFANDCVCELLPEFADLKACASGVILMPILGSQENAILWFRPEIIETVNWGGDPEKAVEVDQLTGKISPRRSFQVWKTEVNCHSQPWKPSDLRAANELRRSISDHLLAKAGGALSSFDLTDSLTGLPSRRRLQNELRVRGENSDQLAVILINLDRFKQVNEAFGHAVGDQLLLQVTSRLATLVGPEVLIARLGGDEFAVLCSGDMGNKANEVAERINLSLASPFQLGGKPFRITASLGVAVAADGEQELLRAADTAMHFAKNSGRNKLVAFNKLLQDAAVRSLELQQDMYRALEAREFRLVYQPIVSFEDASLHGFEALLRWHHPTQGMIPPLDFIPLAEETGIIVQIGKMILEEAIETTQRWSATYGRALKIHVNVAAPQLVGPSFVQDVNAALNHFSLSPASLSIEVTESVLMRDSAVETLTALKGLGIEVSIDDFGTGYSSLAYLQKLPVDIVKIDKTFINDIAEDTKSREFLGVLLLLTRTLGLTSIAEGVETAAQRNLLNALDCRYAQGYLFSRPLDARSAEEFIAKCKASAWLLPGA
jgi:diguanylate cyclase (GGDEF)-like protein